ncbi:hypothetical protein BB560_005924 [Smittium megazygosporum]|uniref:Zn(2)-C6 fungal-type domain-containing protein n=1 Tax=Smittium megazygosporum TaxID=133381 RepID=A0A2T9YQH5_9FUNG|nr:hypothetical protein BB560_005924 [Smittium megazygosporum]
MSTSKLVVPLVTFSTPQEKRKHREDNITFSPTPITYDYAFLHKISALQLFGNILFSCTVCRRKKKKCNGQRPNCSSCIKHNVACNYTVSYSDSINQKDIDLINDKIERINVAIDYLEHILSPSSHAFESLSSELIISNPPVTIQKFINRTIPELLSKKSLNSRLSNQTISILKNISSNLNILSSLSSSSFIELGYHKIDKFYLLKMMENVGNSSSALSFVFRFSFIRNQILSGTISKAFVAGFLAYTSKFIEDSAVFKSNSSFSGSYYIKMVFDLLCQDMENTSVFTCLASAFVGVYHFFIGNFSQALNFLELAIKDSRVLGLSKLDFSETNYKENTPEWEELEFKRRVWWVIYVCIVYCGLGSNRNITIDDDYICVKLPKNDIYYRDGTTDTPIDSFYQNLALKSPGQPIADCACFYIRAIRVINQISNFINRRHLKRNSDSVQSLETINFLDSCISKIKSEYISSLGKMPQDVLEDDTSIESPLDYDEICKYPLSINCYFIFKFARLLLYRSEIVHYSLDKESMIRVRKAKAICINSALQFTNQIDWILLHLSTEYFIENLPYLSFNVGMVLCNALELTDHPLHKKIQSGYETVRKIIKYYMKYRPVVCKYDKALNFIQDSIQKVKTTNEPYLKQFKELELAALTPMDLNPWVVPTGSSLSTEPCCHFNHNFPILKHTLLPYWANYPALLKSRFIKSGINKKNKISKSEFSQF